MTTPDTPEHDAVVEVDIANPPEATKETARKFKAPGKKWESLDLIPDDDKESEKEVGRNLEALTQTLLTSMQMQHVIVLAGSGCSRGVDGPSMQRLWEKAVEEKTAKKAAIDTAKKVNVDLAGADKNIEAFLSKIEAYLEVYTDKDVGDFLSACKKVILDECSNFLSEDKLHAHRIFLHRMSRRRVRDSRLQVFTTNYDLCFERAAAALGCVALDGFSFTHPRQYDPRFFGYDIVRRRAGADETAQYLEGVFLLYKMHGSVNWARDWDGGISEKSKPDPWEACMIYPAAGKYQQSYSQPYLESMARFLAAVREPNTCVLVVGFGFNDDHLTQPLLAAVKSNPHLRLIVVDPCAEKNEIDGNRHWKEIASLSKRSDDVWLVNADFPQFANLIPDLKALTPAESLMKAMQGAVKQS